MLSVVDRMPEAASRRFADLLLKAVRLPRRGLPQPLSADEQQLVKLNVRHYVDTQPEDVRMRLEQYLNGGKLPADRCWAVGQIIEAVMSGDEDLAALGVRMFAGQFARN
jgi:hypothetical protein